MIRQATIEDLPRIEACALEFYAASRILGRLPFDLEKFVGAWTDLIRHGIGVMFIAEESGEVTGALGGVIYPDLYSGIPVATEFFWTVRQQFRGPGVRLYKAFEAWARERGCAEIRMVHLMDSMPERVAKFYRHFGYEQSEVHFVKGLST